MIIQAAGSPVPVAQSDARAPAVVPRIGPRPAPQPAPDPSPQQVEQAIEVVNRAARASNSSLEFSFDASTRRVLVRMVDTQSGELIRQIPSKAAIAIAESIGEYQKGLLLSQKA